MAVSRLTTTPCLASASAPRESDTVVTTGSASGTTLTTRAMANTSSSSTLALRPLSSRLAAITITSVARIMRRMKRLKRSIERENSDSFVVSTVSLAMLPIRVCTPVASTSATASPSTTVVPLKARLWLS